MSKHKKYREVMNEYWKKRNIKETLDFIFKSSPLNKSKKRRIKKARQLRGVAN